MGGREAGREGGRERERGGGKTDRCINELVGRQV